MKLLGIFFIFIVVICSYKIIRNELAMHHIQREHERHSPLNWMIDNDKFHAKLLDPPHWMEEQIERDLRPFKEKKVSLKDLNTKIIAWNIPTIAHFKIKNNELILVGNRYVQAEGRYYPIVSALQQLLKIATLPDVEFLIELGDYIKPSEQPIFGFAKDKHNKGILIPDAEILQNGHRTLKEEILHYASLFPWETKIEKIFWRGTTSGPLGAFRKDNWQKFPRVQLIMLSKTFPNMIDALFTSTAYPQLLDLLQKKEYIGDVVPIKDHLLYKYMFDIDGFSSTFSRLYWQLLSNSVVFKHQSDNIQWYYGALMPWVHYIPVAQDFSDIEERFNWATLHDTEAREIALEATRFAEEHLSPESTLVYLHLLFKEYASLFAPN